MKKLVFIFYVTMVSIGCSSPNTPGKKDVSIDSNKIDPGNLILDLPFTGKRNFETRPGVSGTGTPHRSVEIEKNGDVYFSFSQQNQAEKNDENGQFNEDAVTEERYYAGKFKRYMKCVFKKWDNETTFYEITKDKIYQVDENNKRLRNEECCTMDNDSLGNKCPCESLWDAW